MLKHVAYASTATGAIVPAPATNGHRHAGSKRDLAHSLLVADRRVSVLALPQRPSPAGNSPAIKDGERDPRGHKEGSIP
jgi:hypothetical protein